MFPISSMAALAVVRPAITGEFRVIPRLILVSGSFTQAVDAFSVSFPHIQTGQGTNSSLRPPHTGVPISERLLVRGSIYADAHLGRPIHNNQNTGSFGVWIFLQYSANCPHLSQALPHDTSNDFLFGKINLKSAPSHIHGGAEWMSVGSKPTIGRS